MGADELIKHSSVCRALSTAWHRESPQDAVGGEMGSLTPWLNPWEEVCKWCAPGASVGDPSLLVAAAASPDLELRPRRGPHRQESPFPRCGLCPDTCCRAGPTSPVGTWGRVGRKEDRPETGIYGALNCGQPLPGSGLLACSRLVEKRKLANIRECLQGPESQT